MQPKPILMRYSQMLELFNEYGINRHQVNQMLALPGVIRKIKLPGSENGRALYVRQEVEDLIQSFVSNVEENK